nr:GTPase domain-containing protein [Phytoactinopolyspora mesophila]
MDAPLLVAVGGSTGAGKSTLVNGIVGDVVTSPGVLRPTTRIPVLVHHPDDTPEFPAEHVLSEQRPVDGIPRGLTLMDTPPLASVADESRSQAPAALETADLWIFMTTAARYADAVPWQVLARAAERRMSVAAVVNRVPPGAVNEIRSHLAGLLASRGLGDAPLFALEEATLDSSGMMPPHVVEHVSRWLHELAGGDAARAAVVRRTVDGAVSHVLSRVSSSLAQAEVDVFDDAARADLTEAVAAGWRARGEAE